MAAAAAAAAAASIFQSTGKLNQVHSDPKQTTAANLAYAFTRTFIIQMIL